MNLVFIYDKKVLIISATEYLEGFKSQIEGKIRKGERNLSLFQRKKNKRDIEIKRAGINFILQ